MWSIFILSNAKRAISGNSKQLSGFIFKSFKHKLYEFSSLTQIIVFLSFDKIDLKLFLDEYFPFGENEIV